VAQQAVETYGWLSAGEMLDGLGLAETTPGPLILVTEFVGCFRHGGEPKLAFGLLGAAVTLWAPELSPASRPRSSVSSSI
jgi:chromate transporter